MTPALNQRIGGCRGAALNPKQLVYVCLVCQESFQQLSDHDFDLCKVQYEMELKWRREAGEVIHAN